MEMLHGVYGFELGPVFEPDDLLARCWLVRTQHDAKNRQTNTNIGIVYEEERRKERKKEDLTFSAGTLDLNVLSTNPSIFPRISGVKSPFGSFSSTSSGNFVQTHKCTMLLSMPYGQSL